MSGFLQDPFAGVDNGVQSSTTREKQDSRLFMSAILLLTCEVPGLHLGFSVCLTLVFSSSYPSILRGNIVKKLRSCVQIWNAKPFLKCEKINVSLVFIWAWSDFPSQNCLSKVVIMWKIKFFLPLWQNQHWFVASNYIKCSPFHSLPALLQGWAMQLFHELMLCNWRTM